MYVAFSFAKAKVESSAAASRAGAFYLFNGVANKG